MKGRDPICFIGFCAVSVVLSFDCLVVLLGLSMEALICALVLSAIEWPWDKRRAWCHILLKVMDF